MIREYAKVLEKLKSDNIYRNLKIQNSNFVNFSSNDYLGLSKNKDVINAGIQAVEKYGSGSAGSRLLFGNNALFEEFEKQIAFDKKQQSALIFVSGFQANSSVLKTLTLKDSIVIFDKLNHASMYDGVLETSTKLLRYNHLDYSQLEDILKKEKSSKIIIASETVFGMDGDIADISILSKLSQKYGTLLYLDEAHATGLYGPNGYGISTNFDLDPEKTIIMGTFSKALGSSGAYVSSSKLIKEFLIQRCKGFIYSTAPSPFFLGCAQKAWLLIKNMKKIREDLLKNTQNLRTKINGSGQNTNIIPIIFENQKDMNDCYEKCLANKIITSAIKRPTSATPRIRIALNTNHSEFDIEKLIGTLK